jgi:hypothetical protein
MEHKLKWDAIKITKEDFETALGYKISDAEWEAVVSRNKADYFPSASVAIPTYFEPQVPCRNFETRPCVDLSLDEETTYRRYICPEGECVRYPKRDHDG